MTSLSKQELASLKVDLNKLAHTLMNAGVDRPSPFGGLRPVKNPRKAEVYSESCYICNDPDFARYGLPLCYPCPYCDGHVAADDGACDDCGKWVDDCYPCPGCGAVIVGGDVKCSDCGLALDTEEERNE